MIDFVRLQEDVTQALLCADGLATVAIEQYRKLRLQSQIDLSSVYLAGRNGQAGCGVLVEMPGFDVQHPNLPGPSAEMTFSCAVLEEPNLNFAPGTGTGLSAEEVAQRILDVLHGLVIEGAGALYADKKAIAAAEEFEGLVAYRVNFRMRVLRPQTERVALPDIAEVGGQVTLSGGTEGADVYYTLDGSFPGPSNAAAIKYTNTFSMAPGGAATILRWAAYKVGMVSSNVGEAVTAS